MESNVNNEGLFFFFLIQQNVVNLQVCLLVTLIGMDK